MKMSATQIGDLVLHAHFKGGASKQTMTQMEPRPLIGALVTSGGTIPSEAPVSATGSQARDRARNSSIDPSPETAPRPVVHGSVRV
jgi:hypothetical protein